MFNIFQKFSMPRIIILIIREFKNKNILELVLLTIIEIKEEKKMDKITKEQ